MKRLCVYVDSEMWNDFKVYAETMGVSASELINRYVKKTVDDNRRRIDRYREGLTTLIISLDKGDD